MDKEEDKKRENAIQTLRSFNYKKSTIDDFKDIFEYDVSVETKDEYDETPLVKAVYEQNKEIDTLQIARQHFPNQRNHLADDYWAAICEQADKAPNRHKELVELQRILNCRK